eukprot:5710202-Prymnesium_polylepis.2
MPRDTRCAGLRRTIRARERSLQRGHLARPAKPTCDCDEPTVPASDGGSAPVGGGAAGAMGV